MKKIGEQTIVFEKNIYIESSGTVVGPKEREGPLGSSFDRAYDDLYCGEQSWELAERRLMKEAIMICLTKGKVQTHDVDLFIAGDLLNQTVTANYVASELHIPFLGVFSACSTMTEAMLVASTFIDGAFAHRVLVATSSHYGAAERQFRFPTTIGVQKGESASWTVTGGAAALLSTTRSPFRIRTATIGRVIDSGVTDPLDMGRAMAPAAFATIRQHLIDCGLSIEAYDVIITGDLGKVGSSELKSLCYDAGMNLSERYDDCGVLIYDTEQQAFAGGSGCACCAVVTYSYFLEKMRERKIKTMLVVATGALFNSTMMKQNQTIPAIAHAIAIEVVT
ncbi:stage V sporulation protein AD [Anoxybacillus flavithermus]|uniref:stage V sporulation protein AD n=1 Tax=Anoxybacillus flavithermus TaxID=33934 RepID=UPI000B4A3175|nr:stage V sporulation protein AD [Anoxybacillus flavithermus]ASA95601.1 stage V sporulation protein AD [Anoxybacillus flavithermus]MBE2904410.1 stage V sporulation protein AD [Anoxybacillus flavithermus]MBE2917367.1 stage V sporulation protein AD [Anoxybacillus flavithermus]MBE2922004.1 stage V sporulation protein AD [Anoxybacillus flavithermus]MBE2923066.1 stage V sporulation protein AD [Anoxybacillus flavithermus]